MPSNDFEFPPIKTVVETDLIARYSTVLPTWLVQVIFALTCTSMVIIARMGVDVFWAGAGPFALIFPMVLIATLFGRWQTGLMTFGLSFSWVWYFVFTPTHTFAFHSVEDTHRAVVNAGSAVFVLLFAELFRRGVQSAVRQRDSEISNRDILLRELDHRTKNNFMIVISLLQLQMRNLKSNEAIDAFGAAVRRIHSISIAHESLYIHEVGIYSSRIPVKQYLESLVTNIFEGLFAGNSVKLNVSIDNMDLPRDQAIAIGLVLNEVMTNAAKHAFEPEQPGTVSVEFRADPTKWNLVVSDNGRGVSTKPGASGLGSTLIKAFATKAGAEVATEQLHPGTRVTVSGPVAA